MLMGDFGRGITLSSSHHVVCLSDQWLTIAPGLQPQQGLWITYWQSWVRWTNHTHTHKKKSPTAVPGQQEKIKVQSHHQTHYYSVIRLTNLCLSKGWRRRAGLSTLAHCGCNDKKWLWNPLRAEASFQHTHSAERYPVRQRSIMWLVIRHRPEERAAFKSSCRRYRGRKTNEAVTIIRG